MPTFLRSVCDAFVQVSAGHPNRPPSLLPMVMGRNTHRVRMLELHHCLSLRVDAARRLLDTLSLEHVAFRNYAPAHTILDGSLHGNWSTALVEHPHRQHKTRPADTTHQTHAADIQEQLEMNRWSADTCTLLLSRRVGGIRVDKTRRRPVFYCAAERQGRLAFYYQDLISGAGVYDGQPRFPHSWLPHVLREPKRAANEYDLYPVYTESEHLW